MIYGSVMTKGSTTLVLGGARSGKSKHAEGLADGHADPLVYIATAQAWDDEMKARIAAHAERRGDRWQTIEEPVALADSIGTHGHAGSFILVDCITLWLTNLLLGEHDIQAAANQLTAAIADCQATLVLVSNEVGQGIVPDNKLARRFRDEAGWLNQELAKTADSVVLVAAGLPLRLK